MGVFHHKKPIITDGLVLSIDGANKLSSFQTDTRSASFNGVNALNGDTLITSLSATTTGTIACWIKVPNTNAGEIISFGDTDGNPAMRCMRILSGGRLSCHLQGASPRLALQTDSTVITPNIWQHIAVVQNGTEPILYHNGIAVPQTFTTSSNKTFWFNSFTPLDLDNGRIGCVNLSNVGNVTFFTGQIDSLMIYDTNISAGGVLSLYNNGIGVNYNNLTVGQKTNLISYHPLNENGETRKDIHSTNDLLDINNVGFDTGVVSEYDFFYSKNMIDGIDGIPQNGVELVDGTMEFDGVNDYIDYGTSVGNSLGSNISELSIDFWVKQDNISSTEGFLTIGAFSSGSGEIDIFRSSGNLIFRLNNGGFQESTPFSDTSTWYNIVAIYTGSEGILYIDSAEKINVSHSANMDTTGLKTIIGTYWNSSYSLTGSISSVKIYNKALTPTEIKQNYNSQKYRFI